MIHFLRIRHENTTIREDCSRLFRSLTYLQRVGLAKFSRRFYKAPKSPLHKGESSGRDNVSFVNRKATGIRYVLKGVDKRYQRALTKSSKMNSVRSSPGVFSSSAMNEMSSARDFPVSSSKVSVFSPVFPIILCTSILFLYYYSTAPVKQSARPCTDSPFEIPLPEQRGGI